MGMYRDSVLGPCVDITGPDGNIFFLLGVGDDLARQLDQVEDWKLAVEATKLMGGSYISLVLMFKEFFPVVTLVGFDEVAKLHGVVDDILAED